MKDQKDRAVIALRQMFSSAHFYNQNQFTEDQNRRIFGACYTPFGHGHNYTLEAFIEGAPTGANDPSLVHAALEELLCEVTRPLDHHHLNFDLAPFSSPTGVVPTTENIAIFLRDRLIGQLNERFPTFRLQRLKLFETDDLWVEIR